MSEKAFSTPEVTENEAEMRKIESVVNEYSERLGDFDIVPVGSLGFILQSKKARPMAGNDWIVYDYDDTLAATTEVKTTRLELFENYLRQKLNLDITQEDAQTVMQASDQFSRWRESPEEGVLYHAGSQMSALTWAVDTLKSEDFADARSATKHIEETLTRIKAQLEGVNNRAAEDPFHFKGSKLILHNKRPWSTDIEEIFQETMLNPPTYDEALESTYDLGKPTTSIHRNNIGVFTYGVPEYQLKKVFNLMAENKDMPISQIWLTKSHKGDFLMEAVRNKVTENFEQDYVPPELADPEDKGIAGGSGYVLSQTPHTLVLFDDDPKELTNVFNANRFLKENTGAQFAVVRSIREKTKTADRQWALASELGEINFTSERSIAFTISETLEINRLVTAIKNLGPESDRVKFQIKILAKKGINIEKPNTN